MLNHLFKTDNSSTALLLRVTLGLVMFPHGAQKLLGWYGGYGLSGTLHHFTENMGIPFILALLAILAESLGAIALVAGLLTRLCAFGIGGVMLVALTMHWDNGFFMNWYGNQAGEGYEYHLLAMGLSAALMLSGGGRFSLDGMLMQSVFSKKRSKE